MAKGEVDENVRNVRFVNLACKESSKNFVKKRKKIPLVERVLLSGVEFLSDA